MGKGWQIFIHSVRQVFGNLPAALRISAALFVALFALGLILPGGSAMGQVSPDQIDGGQGFGALLAALIAIALSLWIAVAWHRFVLRREGGDTLIPAFRGGAMLRYLGWSLAIGLMLIPVALIGVLVVGGLLGGAMMGPGGGIGVEELLAIGTLVYVPVFTLFYRLSPMLPAAALSEPLKLGEAWAATRGASGALFVLSALTAAGMLVTELIAAGLPGILGLITGFAGQWILTMVGASILTTIYGHYVEKRPLVA